MKFNELPKPIHRFITTGIRRAFAFSEIYDQKFRSNRVDWNDGSRNRVSYPCSQCKQLHPKQTSKLDHDPPVIPLDSCLDEMTVDQYTRAVFYGPTQILCVPCHKIKTAKENAVRRANKIKERHK